MNLTLKHIKLYQAVAERGEGRCCNDLEPSEVKMLTKEEWQEFAQAYHDWNGDPEEYNPEYAHHMMDFMVIGFVQNLLIDSYIESHGL
jgi:hypothetical protein